MSTDHTPDTDDTERPATIFPVEVTELSAPRSRGPEVRSPQRGSRRPALRKVLVRSAAVALFAALSGTVAVQVLDGDDASPVRVTASSAVASSTLGVTEVNGAIWASPAPESTLGVTEVNGAIWASPPPESTLGVTEVNGAIWASPAPESTLGVTEVNGAIWAS